MILRELFSCSSIEEMKATISSRPCLYGVYSRPVGGFAPIDDLCVSCYRCVIENPKLVQILPNPEFQELGNSPITPRQVSAIWYESTTGRVPVRGAGYNGPFSGSGFDSMWTDMSEIVRPTRDGIHGREFISTSVDLGRKLSSLSFDEHENLRNKRGWSIRLPIPIILDSLPIDQPQLHAAVAAAAKELQTFYFVEGLNSSLKPHEASCVPVLTVQEFEGTRSDLSIYPAVEVECRTVDECKAALRRNDTRLFIRVEAKANVENLICDFVDAGANVIHLSADWTGMEKGHNPRFIKDVLRAVHTKLAETRKRDEVTLIASGGIVAAEHVPKAIICGADIVALNIPVVIALQGSVTGGNGRYVPIELPQFERSWATQRILNLIGSWHVQLLEILSAMGLREVRRLRGEVGRAMFAEDFEKEFCETICGSNCERS